MHFIFLVPSGVFGACLLLFFVLIFWFSEVPKKVRRKILRLTAGVAAACFFWVLCVAALAHYKVIPVATPWDDQPMANNLPKRDDAVVVPVPVDTSDVKKISPLEKEKQDNKARIRELDQQR